MYAIQVYQPSQQQQQQKIYNVVRLVRLLSTRYKIQDVHCVSKKVQPFS